MLYTLGRTTFYEQGLDEHGAGWRKSGRYGSYKGGSVFLTEEEALEYITRHGLDGYTIYGLLTNVGNTYMDAGERHLISGCQIVRIA